MIAFLRAVPTFGKNICSCPCLFCLETRDDAYFEFEVA